MINKLIEKYKNKVNHHRKNREWEYNGYQMMDFYQEIIKDLEELKTILLNGEGMENLADIEHQRWSKWQKYLHSLCVKNEDGSLTIPKDRVEHWNWEIQTVYEDLPENIKEYDRAEVRNTLKEIIGE